MTCSSPTCSRMRPTCSSMTCAPSTSRAPRRPGTGSCAARPCRAACARPRGGTARRRCRARGAPSPRPGVARRRCRDPEALGRPHDRVGGSSTRLVVREVVEQHRVAVELDAVLPVLAGPVRRPRRRGRGPAPTPRSRCPAPGRRGRDGRVEGGRASAYDDAGPPERTTPAGRARRILGGRVVVRHELGVHPALAHAARDELRVLRAEVEHEDRRCGLPAHAAARAASAQRPIPTLCSRCSVLPSVLSAGATMISAFWNSWIVS